MDQGTWRAGVREHARGEVHPDWAKETAVELTAEVPRAASDVEDHRTNRQLESINAAVPPTPVHPERHDPVDQLVAAGDGVEHLADGLDLFGAGG